MKARECLAFNIKKLRKAKGFKSSRLLAEETDISPVTLARFEASLGYPSEGTVSKIANTLGCEESDLFKDPNTGIDIDQALILMQNAMNLIKNVPPEFLEVLSSVDWSSRNIDLALSDFATAFSENKSGKKASGL